MSPRPRKVSDAEVFAAAYRAMNRLSPGDLTLAEIAGEAGLTAGALVQRFGSKRALLLALAEGAARSTTGFIEGLRARHRSSLPALREYAECFAQMADSPAALARSLAYLQVDLTDPEFYQILLVQARATRAGLRALVAAAVQSRELAPGTDARALARMVESLLSGSMMTWAIYREGSARRWMRDDLDALLAPHLARRRRR